MKNNIEDTIKKQIEARKIQPSDALWEQLESQLPTAENKKKKTVWMYYAAACLAILLCSIPFWNNNNGKVENHNFIETTIQIPTLETPEKQNNIVENQIVANSNKPKEIEKTLFEKVIPEPKKNKNIVKLAEVETQHIAQLQPEKNIEKQEPIQPEIIELEKHEVPKTTEFMVAKNEPKISTKKSYLQSSTLLNSVENQDEMLKYKENFKDKALTFIDEKIIK